MNRLLPSHWQPNLHNLLPGNPAIYNGPSLAQWILYIYLTLISARSCIHLFTPDGGAHSIATIDISGSCGANIVGLFGQWGAMQLLFAGFLWVLLLRYRGLLPLILATLMLEPLLRGLSGHFKPIISLHTAPGAAFNYAPLPLLAILLYLALCPAHDRALK
jgi:hypothetical protein